ncbi:MAG TPA: FadR family transcriptional regulator [Anaerolineaceae bacterium]|nr:FadR family transcriptional regulator [Anaerolineaceae bacterium]
MAQEKQTLLEYLAKASKNGDDIPSIAELSQILGVSIANVREQLEVARQLGFVEVRPRTGIQQRAFSMVPLIRLGMRYGIHSEPKILDDYIDMRKHLELVYWDPAFKVINDNQIDYMQFLVDVAFRKLQRKPAIIPHEEQSEFHLTIFRPLGNKLLINFLEAYWDLETTNSVRFFMDLDDMLSIWSRRQVLVDALREKNAIKGKKALESLLTYPIKPRAAEIKQQFE